VVRNKHLSATWREKTIAVGLVASYDFSVTGGWGCAKRQSKGVAYSLCGESDTILFCQHRQSFAELQCAHSKSLIKFEWRKGISVNILSALRQSVKINAAIHKNTQSLAAYQIVLTWA